MNSIEIDENKEMTLDESLSIITETLNNCRHDILQTNAKYFVLWGCLTAVFSLAVYLLWHFTGHPEWNLLWFAMPLVGYPLAVRMGKKDWERSTSEIGIILRNLWFVTGVFAIVIATLGTFFLPLNVTLLIMLLLGIGESISGVVLKNWPMLVADFVIGIGGAVTATLFTGEAQTLLLTLGGAVLAVSGVVIKKLKIKN